MRKLRLGTAEAQAGFDPRSPLYKASAPNFTQPETDLSHDRVLGKGSVLGQPHEPEQGVQAGEAVPRLQEDGELRLASHKVWEF